MQRSHRCDRTHVSVYTIRFSQFPHFRYNKITDLKDTNNMNPRWKIVKLFLDADSALSRNIGLALAEAVDEVSDFVQYIRL